jgi:hypothetical protein
VSWNVASTGLGHEHDYREKLMSLGIFMAQRHKLVGFYCLKQIEISYLNHPRLSSSVLEPVHKCCRIFADSFWPASLADRRGPSRVAFDFALFGLEIRFAFLHDGGVFLFNDVILKRLDMPLP